VTEVTAIFQSAGRAGDRIQRILSQFGGIFFVKPVDGTGEGDGATTEGSEKIRRDHEPD